jgi:hypothetical protein
MENLLEAWREFVRGKRYKPDVQEFSLHLRKENEDFRSAISPPSFL